MKRKFWPLAIAMIVNDGWHTTSGYSSKRSHNPKQETLVSQSDVTITVVNEDQGYRYNSPERSLSGYAFGRWLKPISIVLKRCHAQQLMQVLK